MKRRLAGWLLRLAAALVPRPEPRHEVELEAYCQVVLPDVQGNGDNLRLTVTARGIHHEGRHGQTGDVAAQVLHDLDALGNGCPKMLQPFRQIALVDVVGAHPIGGEHLHELSHQRPAVIDTGQKN